MQLLLVLPLKPYKRLWKTELSDAVLETLQFLKGLFYRKKGLSQENHWYIHFGLHIKYALPGYESLVVFSFYVCFFWCTDKKEPQNSSWNSFFKVSSSDGWSRLNMVEHVWTWLNMVEHGLTWLNMVEHGWTWLNMVEHGLTRLNMVEHGWTWWNMVFSMIEHGWTWSNRVEHGWTPCLLSIVILLFSDC